MTHEGITVNIDRTEQVIKASIQAMRAKEGLFATANTRPESEFVSQVKSKGRDFSLNAVFLITPMILGSQTVPFFQRISNPALMEGFSWLFEPTEVARRRPYRVREACTKFFKPGGANQQETIRQWHYNCKLLVDRYGGQVRNLFEADDTDALRVYRHLIVYPRAKTSEKEFRRFGPKIAKLFIQYVRIHDLYELKNSDAVGVPVDFQVARVLIQTNGVSLTQPEHNHFINGKLLPLIFEHFVQQGFKPEDISEALWTIGSQGCAPRAHNLCPVKDKCSSLISSRPYYEKGLFDPFDVGRFSG